MITIWINNLVQKTNAMVPDGRQPVPELTTANTGAWKSLPLVIGVFTYAAMMYFVLHQHIMWTLMNTWLGLLSLPFVTIIRYGDTGHRRYGYWAILLALVCCLLPVNTLFFEATVLAIFFVIETFVGKTNSLPFIITAMMSPLFQFVSSVFTFPIRLKLTAWTAAGMQKMGSNVTVQGNMLIEGGKEFTVDPACMGLNMMVTSLVLLVLLIAIYQQKLHRRLAWWQTGILLMLVFIFNLVANVLRIVMLVNFSILPDNIMHEIMGLLCWTAYVLVPAVFITKWMIRRAGRSNQTIMATAATTRWPLSWLIQAILLILMAVAVRQLVQRNESGAIDVVSKPVPGYKQQKIGTDVVKLENDQSLVYIKPIPGFYSADHNPMICWRGSGYQLKQTEEAVIGTQTVYRASLQKERDRLYTAWWYDDGLLRTISQWDWRTDALLHRKRFSLVNITAASKKQLEQEIMAVLADNRFCQLIRSQ
ncbi:exosortase N [Paraflavitalea pollutisoli]|uniref:exosortase N n=1 Tax=Paraflavitalea pollutisoli TaxID=3034143 RepID=UPI0023EC14B9|nr:exosortase N [Paraflavitalea sp. H1-2-19X]